MPRNRAPKDAKMVNSMLCAFYHNLNRKKKKKKKKRRRPPVRPRFKSNSLCLLISCRNSDCVMLLFSYQPATEEGLNEFTHTGNLLTNPVLGSDSSRAFPLRGGSECIVTELRGFPGHSSLASGLYVPPASPA